MSKPKGHKSGCKCFACKRTRGSSASSTSKSKSKSKPKAKRSAAKRPAKRPAKRTAKRATRHEVQKPHNGSAFDRGLAEARADVRTGKPLRSTGHKRDAYAEGYRAGVTVERRARKLRRKA